MRFFCCVILVWLFMLMTSCGGTDSKSAVIKTDEQTEKVYVGNYQLKPRPELGFNQLLGYKSDTLSIVACGDSIFWPIGKITQFDSLRYSKLKNFKLVTRKRNSFVNTEISSDSIWNEEVLLVLGTDSLLLFLDNDPHAAVHSNILSGKIQNPRVVLCNHLRIGISKREFVSIYFEEFPILLLDKINVFQFHTCVAGLRHQYVFRNGLLCSIRFEKD